MRIMETKVYKFNELSDKAKERFNNLVYNAKQVLRDSYYYLISDESIIETIECNDYEFTEEGKLI
jgi:hypothetical protein